MASTENDFFAAQANAEYPLLRQQLAALEKLVTDPAVPACKVAQDICAPIIAARQRALANPDHPDEYGYSILWRTIADAIRDLTDQNDRLVNLVVEISKVQDEEGYITHMYDYNEYWSSEGFEFREPGFNNPEKEAKRQAWLNMNRFCAKVSKSGIEKLDERRRSGWVFRTTLERTPWEEFHHPDIDERLQEYPDDEVVEEWANYQLDLRDVRNLNSWVPAAAAWIKINVDGIYALNGTEMDDERDWSPSNWKGDKGWSKVRFRFWRDRFIWISKVTALDKWPRKDAAEAAEVMTGFLGE